MSTMDTGEKTEEANKKDKLCLKHKQMTLVNNDPDLFLRHSYNGLFISFKLVNIPSVLIKTGFCVF